MNDQELYDNFLYACVTYANNNGSKVTDTSTLCELYDDGSGEMQILSWNHDSKQPTDDQLKAYTLEQVQLTATTYNNQALINNAVILSFTTSERDVLVPPEGVIIYNKTTKQLQLYTDSWKVLSFS